MKIIVELTAMEAIYGDEKHLKFRKNQLEWLERFLVNTVSGITHATVVEIKD